MRVTLPVPLDWWQAQLLLAAVVAMVGLPPISVLAVADSTLITHHCSSTGRIGAR